MPGVITHTMVGLTLTGTVFGAGGPGKTICGMKRWRFFLLGAVCAAIVDVDIIAQAMLTVYYRAAGKVGLEASHAAYIHPLGHRGFTHSILFAVLLGFTVVLVGFRKKIKRFSGKWWLLVLFFIVCVASEGTLDSMTHGGGQGVGFFIPFDNSRYWMPWQPIRVSPIGAFKYFEGGREAVMSGNLKLTAWGKEVIRDELTFVWAPMMTLLVISTLLRKIIRTWRQSELTLEDAPGG